MADTPATKTKPADAIAAVRIKHLKAREANLQDKISNRIPKLFDKSAQQPALDRANKHLEDIRKEIKGAS